MRVHTTLVLFGAALAVAGSFAACRRVSAGGSTAPGNAHASKDAPAAQLLPLTLTHPQDAKPVVGSEIVVHADSLQPRLPVNLLWGTVDGGWVVEDGFRFRGKQFKDSTRVIQHAEVGADGHLATRFTVPEDFGGVHTVTVVNHAGVPLAQGGVEVTQTFEMRQTEGPIGTPIEIRVTGLGWRTMESTWTVNWDNREVGFVSATDTRGSATARFRATGPIGDHQIKIYTGYMGQSYLNHEQAPTAYLPRPAFTFRVTPGEAVTGGYAEAYQAQKVPAPEISVSGATLNLAPSQGPVRTAATLKGTGFPAHTSLSLIWGTQAGSRVSGNGFAPEEHKLGTIAVSADGHIDAPVAIPDDLGGLHTLSLRAADKTIARASFAIETSIASLTPASGPAGTPITIHLKGVGWTDFDNIYVATYDNAYMGYACGFNSQGDVVVNFTAAGLPGVHLIDFYPAIYQGPQTDQQLYRLPQLTYQDDHPGNKIPALRFAFEVTSR